MHLHRVVRTAFLSVLACAVVVEISLFSRQPSASAGHVARPAGLAQLFGHRATQVKVDIDSNLDGRPDIQEYYEDGALVRRESDRNFDDQVDLIEEFDAATQEHIRSVVDVDYDGTADLLVLFREGRPVFTQYDAGPKIAPAPTTRAVAHSVAARSSLAPLNDPFSAQSSVRGTRAPVTPLEAAGLSTSGGLPVARASVAAPAQPAPFANHVLHPSVLPAVAAASPRAPPTA